MRLRHELSYDAAAPEVRAMLLDPDYWDLVAHATEAISSDCVVEASGDDARVVVDQQQAVTGVPAFARKFVGESTQAVKTQQWQGNSATMEIQTPGKPTHISGTATLEERGTCSVLVYELEVKASVPLIGGKLEKLVADLTAEGFDTEQQVGAAWLAGER